MEFAGPPSPVRRGLLARAVPGWWLVLAWFGGRLLGAPEPTASALIFEAQAESRVRITGRATLGNWECESKTILATIEPGPTLSALANQVGQGGSIPVFDAKNFRVPHALITIPVTSLQCNKPGMRDDLLRALREDEAPLIVFLLTGISDVVASPAGPSDLGRYRVAVRGDLVLAGKSRAIELAADVVQESATRFRIDAQTALRMSDFEIIPPTALLGLIRTEDQVTVSFHLVFVLVGPAVPPASFSRTP